MKSNYPGACRTSTSEPPPPPPPPPPPCRKSVGDSDAIAPLSNRNHKVHRPPAHALHSRPHRVGGGSHPARPSSSLCHALSPLPQKVRALGARIEELSPAESPDVAPVPDPAPDSELKASWSSVGAGTMEMVCVVVFLCCFFGPAPRPPPTHTPCRPCGSAAATAGQTVSAAALRRPLSISANPHQTALFVGGSLFVRSLSFAPPPPPTVQRPCDTLLRFPPHTGGGSWVAAAFSPLPCMRGDGMHLAACT